MKSLEFRVYAQENGYTVNIGESIASRTKVYVAITTEDVLELLEKAMTTFVSENEAASLDDEEIPF